MAEAIVAELVKFVGEKLLSCIAEPITRRYNHLRHFNRNVEKLRKEAGSLEDARVGLWLRVNTAKNNAEVILPGVNTWFKDVDEIQEKMTRIDREITNIQSGCFAVKSRLSLSKEAENTIIAMKELQERCRNFEVISDPAPPAAAALVPLQQTYEFESRKDIENDVVKALREFNMVGICGMGGVGKTTMAKRVMNRVKEERLFEETVMAVVSQKIDLLKIQNEIAEQLGLKLEGESSTSKAHKLRTRLIERKSSTDEKTSTDEKRILIVLDDVWENLKLEEIGIPCEIGLKGCKVLLTSRDRGVLTKMDAPKVCEIKTLTEVEAGSLFREKVGTCVNDDDVHSVAQEVIRECKGLPIALVTVGMALKDQKDISIWKDVQQQLKNSNPEDMPEVLEDVYKPLKVSYDKLEGDHAKSLFLLCCLFPEDANIPISELSYYVMGLGMLEEITNFEPARNRICYLVERLKNRFLLLQGRNKYHVKMHDVVRDVAIFIASKERQLIKCGDKCTWISPFVGGRMELPMGNLRLLSIDNSTGEKLQINNNFFEGMTRLNVLSIKKDSSSSLPDTIQLVKNLRTLILHSCRLVETISVVGELVNLEILSCCNCDSIENLPKEIGQLDRLKVLEFLDCEKLKTIEPGIIQKLVGLEELKMVNSFDKWEAENNEGKKRKNAGLKELLSLDNLTCLEIEVEDLILAAERISLPSKIVNFYIAMDNKKSSDRKMEFKKQMELNLPREITLGDWIHQCVRGVECLDLAGDGSNYLDLRQAQSMKSLTFVNSSTVKKLVNITSSSIGGRCGTTVFPRLEYLSLDKLINLEEIYDIDGPIPDEGSGSKSFKNLKKLRLTNLPALKHFVEEFMS